MSQAVIDFVVEGYRRYNERDRSLPWPDDEKAARWHEDGEYRSAREDPDYIAEFFDRDEAFEAAGISR